MSFGLTREVPAAAPYPSAARAWWALALFITAVLLAYLDRQVLALLVEPVKRDLALSDTQIGLLQGPAFALFYAFAAVPLGWLVDRMNRRNLIIAGLLGWSVMTALCGFAQDFWTLFACRVGVGVGEACLMPAVFSLIGDYFAPARRRAAFGVYVAVVLVGASLALAAGGAAYTMLERAGVMLPGLAQTWRLTLVIVALPAPLLALAFLSTPEPVRQERRAVQQSAHWAPLLQHVRAHRGVLLWGVLAVALVSMTFQMVLAWFPVALVREHGWTPGRTGLLFGAASGVASLAAAVLTVRLTDILTRFGIVAEPMIAAGLALAPLAAVAAVCIVFAPSGGPALLAASIVFFAALLPYALSPMFLQSMIPNEMRGTIVAGVKIVEYLFVACGSVLVGAGSDALSGARGLSLGLIVVIVPCIALTAYALSRARRASTLAVQQAPQEHAQDA